MSNHTSETSGGRIRETYCEYETDDGVVARIADPGNDRAWIESTTTYDVLP